MSYNHGHLLVELTKQKMPNETLSQANKVQRNEACSECIAKEDNTVEKCAIVPADETVSIRSFNSSLCYDTRNDHDYTPPFSSLSPSSRGESCDETVEETLNNANCVERISAHSESVPGRSVSYPCSSSDNIRKRKRNPQEWQKNLAKSLRNSGLSYSSVKVIKKENGVSERKLVLRDAKRMLPPCNEKCRLNCSTKFSEVERRSIFNQYWAMSNLQNQRMFIASSMTTIKPRYRYLTAEKQFRGLNNAFYFDHVGKRIRVCKAFFMATLGINSRIIRTVLAKRDGSMAGVLQPDKRGKHVNRNAVSVKMKEDVRNHIHSIPRLDRRYCRSQSKIEYIEGGKTVADLHRDYEQTCEELGKPHVNYLMYSNIFKEEFNISFQEPKNDTCDFCQGFNNSTDEEKMKISEEYNIHIEEIELARRDKEKDTKSLDKLVTVFNLQAALPCPHGDASSFYYVSKLNTYNLSFYELHSCECFCFMWHEGQADRGVNEIGSSLWYYLKNANDKASGELDIVFYTDNCAGKNKNRFIFALYIYAVSILENVKSITHKFLVTGHIQNEGDHVHSVIERAVKQFRRGSPIYVPDQYLSIIRQARKRGKKYNVHELCHSDFYDIKLLAQDIGMKDSYETEKGDLIQLSKISVLKITKENPVQLLYKTSFKQTHFDSINVSTRPTIENYNITLKDAYKRRVGITPKKKQSLLSLFTRKEKGVSVMPKYYKDFYENL